MKSDTFGEILFSERALPFKKMLFQSVQFHGSLNSIYVLPEAHLLFEVGNHLLSQFLKLSLFDSGGARTVMTSLNLNFLFEPSNFTSQVRNNGLILGDVIGNIQDIFPDLQITNQASLNMSIPWSISHLLCW